MASLRHWHDEDREVERLAEKIDRIAISGEKEKAMSRLPVNMRDKVELHLQNIYHNRQQEFEINKIAATIAQLKDINKRRDASLDVPLSIRDVVEKRTREFFCQVRKERKNAG